MDCAEPLLQLTRSFWNANPCDGQADVSTRMRFRYLKEPWLPRVLDGVAACANVLEVGCGQGTDALYCCQRMNVGGSYIGVDYSDASIASARRSLQQCCHRLSVVPQFTVGNAEALQFEQDRFDCVLSIGVLHHTPNTQQAIDEVYRVLKPGGRAVIALYRLASPKVFSAHAIRGVARAVDVLLGRERVLYDLCGRLGSNHCLGTMLLECLGVPILKSYTRGEIRRMFSRFDDVSIRPIGIGLALGPLRSLDRGANPLGALWLVEAHKKPVPAASGQTRVDHGTRGE